MSAVKEIVTVITKMLAGEGEDSASEKDTLSHLKIRKLKLDIPRGNSIFKGQKC